MAITSARDLFLATRTKRAGANYSLRIIWEARRAGIPISAGFALVQKESDFHNVFGNDPTSSIPNSWKGGTVTKDRYLSYKRNRPSEGMQGVGPTQLTWYEFQDKADSFGGCWNTRHNIRVGLEIFGGYYRSYKKSGQSTRRAMQLSAQKYNGTGSAAETYGRDFLTKYDRWHKILT